MPSTGQLCIHGDWIRAAGIQPAAHHHQHPLPRLGGFRPEDESRQRDDLQEVRLGLGARQRFVGVQAGGEHQGGDFPVDAQKGDAVRIFGALPHALPTGEIVAQAAAMEVELVEEGFSLQMDGSGDVRCSRGGVVFGSVATEAVDAADETTELIRSFVECVKRFRNHLLGHGAVAGDVSPRGKGAQVKPHCCLRVEGAEDASDLDLNGVRVYGMVGTGKILLAKDLETTLQMGHRGLVIPLQELEDDEEEAGDQGTVDGLEVVTSDIFLQNPNGFVVLSASKIMSLPENGVLTAAGEEAVDANGFSQRTEGYCSMSDCVVMMTRLQDELVHGRVEGVGQIVGCLDSEVVEAAEFIDGAIPIGWGDKAQG